MTGYKINIQNQVFMYTSNKQDTIVEKTPFTTAVKKI